MDSDLRRIRRLQATKARRNKISQVQGDKVQDIHSAGSHDNICGSDPGAHPDLLYVPGFVHVIIRDNG